MSIVRWVTRYAGKAPARTFLLPVVTTSENSSFNTPALSPACLHSNYAPIPYSPSPSTITSLHGCALPSCDNNRFESCSNPLGFHLTKKDAPLQKRLIIIWRRAGDSSRCLRQRSSAYAPGGAPARHVPEGTCRPLGFESPRIPPNKKRRSFAEASHHNLAESWGFEPQIGFGPILA